jgi:hypothetical protein
VFDPEFGAKLIREYELLMLELYLGCKGALYFIKQAICSELVKVKNSPVPHLWLLAIGKQILTAGMKFIAL